MSQSTLAKLSPLPQSMISNIVNSKYTSSLSRDKIRSFQYWYEEYTVSGQYKNRQDVPYEWTDDLVRQTVLDLLKVMNQSTLAKLSPLPQSMISNIVNSKYTSSLSKAKLRSFGNWHKKYTASQQGESEVPMRKRNKKGTKNQSRENDGRNVDRQGFICKVDILQDHSGYKSDEVKSKIRKTVLGNRTKNTSSNSGASNLVSDNQEQEISHHECFTYTGNQPNLRVRPIVMGQGDQYCSNTLNKYLGYSIAGVDRGMPSQDGNEGPLYHHLC